jgi:hypothetical protein
MMSEQVLTGTVFCAAAQFLRNKNSPVHKHPQTGLFYLLISSLPT